MSHHRHLDAKNYKMIQSVDLDSVIDIGQTGNKNQLDLFHHLLLVSIFVLFSSKINHYFFLDRAGIHREVRYGPWTSEIGIIYLFNNHVTEQNFSLLHDVTEFDGNSWDQFGKWIQF